MVLGCGKQTPCRSFRPATSPTKANVVAQREAAQASAHPCLHACGSLELEQLLANLLEVHLGLETAGHTQRSLPRVECSKPEVQNALEDGP